MCGIVGYAGDKKAYPYLIQGLKRLEYRGYDSAGLAIYGENLEVHKCKGRVADLEEHVISREVEGSIGIAHTRWATHGEPNDRNAHPHTSMKGHFALVHNGIIENYAELKVDLIRNGFEFSLDYELCFRVPECCYPFDDFNILRNEVWMWYQLPVLVKKFGNDITKVILDMAYTHKKSRHVKHTFKKRKLIFE